MNNKKFLASLLSKHPFCHNNDIYRGTHQQSTPISLLLHSLLIGVESGGGAIHHQLPVTVDPLF